MTIKIMPSKTPNDILDYAFDWNDSTVGPYLEPGETIASYTITTDGVTLVSDSETDGKVSVVVSGGKLKDWAHITCQIVTTGAEFPRTVERTMRIRIEEL